MTDHKVKEAKMENPNPVTKTEMLEWVEIACDDCSLRDHENQKKDCGQIDETCGGEHIQTSSRCRVVRRAIVRLIRLRKTEARKRRIAKRIIPHD